MKICYTIWFFGNGSVTSGTIESKFAFLARRKLNIMLRRGFITRIGFFVSPNSIDRVEVEE